MSDVAVYLQPAFILQHRPYRETSLLLDMFTRDHGIVTVLAKGVRKEKSRLAGLLLPFSCLNISYLDKHELKVLTQAEFVNRYPLQRLALYCGFYLNELVQQFLHKHDPHPQVFNDYQQCLDNLQDAGLIEQSLRYFELALLEEAGYGIQLDIDSRSGLAIDRQQRYRLIAAEGIEADASGRISGHTLRALADRAPLQGAALSEAKWLLRQMLDLHLQGRRLKSRDVLARIITHL